MEQEIILNIHYTAPQDIWDKIGKVYESMPYWSSYDCGPHWKGDDIDLVASVEPGGLQIYGTMPDDIWTEWCSDLIKRLSEAVGYEVGNPEDGYEFKYWK